MDLASPSERLQTAESSSHLIRLSWDSFTRCPTADVTVMRPSQLPSERCAPKRSLSLHEGSLGNSLPRLLQFRPWFLTSSTVCSA